MSSDTDYIIGALTTLFRSMRYTNYRTNAKTGKLNSDGSLNENVSIGLTLPYVWVRYGDDRAAVPVLSKIRAVAGIDVIVAFDTLFGEDVVIEVNLARAALTLGEYAPAYNIPLVPPTTPTPVVAQDVQPGSVQADGSLGGLTVRVLPTWVPGGGWWDGNTLITLTPTSTSGRKSLALIGIDPTDDTYTTELTADRMPTLALIASNGVPTATGAADILTVVEAHPTIWWVGAVELENGTTAVDPAKIIDLRFWNTPGMTGADGSNAGAAGLVPAPGATDNTKYLRGDGTYDTPTGGSSGAYILIRDEKAQGTNGGTFTSGARRTRDLNTEVDDTGGHASVGSNQITLAAGTYRALIFAPAYFCGTHQAFLHNVTDAADILIGMPSFSPNSGGDVTLSVIVGRFTLASTKVLEVQHECSITSATYGFGAAANQATEIYTTVELTRE